MVAIDISKLDTLRYGIVAFPVCYKANVATNFSGYWDPVEDRWPEHEPDVCLTSERPRVLTDLRQYLVHNSAEYLDIRALALYRIADQAVLSYIWPSSSRDPPYTDTEQHPWISRPLTRDSRGVLARLKSHVYLVPPFVNRLRNSEARRQRRLARVDRAVDAFLLEAQGHLDHEMTTLKALRKSAEQLSLLRQKIQTTPTMLEKCQDPVQLLQIAYTGCAHLNWATFSKLSYETLAQALLSIGLKMGSSLSLAAIPDRDGDLDTLIDAVLKLPSLREVNLLELPDRHSDEVSMRMYSKFLRSMKDTGPLRKTISSAGAFSAPLCKSRTLLPHTAADSKNVVPTLRICLNRVVMSEHLDTRLVEKLWPLDDILLSPERFTRGFIHFLGDIASDKAFLHFSCGPIAIDTEQPSQLAVSPIPADPFVDLIEEAEGEVSSQAPPETIPESSWVIVLHVAEHVNMNVMPLRVHLDRTTVVQYSCLKVTRDINLRGGQDTESCLADALDVVGGLKDFLSYVAPFIDADKIDELLERAEKDLRKDGNDTLPPDMQSIALLPDAEALSILARTCRVPICSSPEDHSGHAA